MQTKVYDLDVNGTFPIPLFLEEGCVLSIVTDDGPSGVCGQSMDVTCPHTVIHYFENEELYRKWRNDGDIHRCGRNVKERVVVVGDWSSPGVVRLVKHWVKHWEM